MLQRLKHGGPKLRCLEVKTRGFCNGHCARPRYSVNSLKPPEKTENQNEAVAGRSHLHDLHTLMIPPSRQAHWCRSHDPTPAHTIYRLNMCMACRGEWSVQSRHSRYAGRPMRPACAVHPCGTGHRIPDQPHWRTGAPAHRRTRTGTCVVWRSAPMAKQRRRRRRRRRR